jgi:hypothetical protein
VVLAFKCCRNTADDPRASFHTQFCDEIFADDFLPFSFFIFLLFEATFLNTFGTSICIQAFVFYSSSLIIKECLLLLKF